MTDDNTMYTRTNALVCIVTLVDYISQRVATEAFARDVLL